MKIVREWAAEFTTQRRQLTSSSKGSWMDSLECEIGRGGVSFSIERLEHSLTRAVGRSRKRTVGRSGKRHIRG